MSDSVSNKSKIVINAIAITAALAVISGYLPLNLPSLMQFQAFIQQASTIRK